MNKINLNIINSDIIQNIFKIDVKLFKMIFINLYTSELSGYNEYDLIIKYKHSVLCKYDSIVDGNLNYSISIYNKDIIKQLDEFILKQNMKYFIN